MRRRVMRAEGLTVVEVLVALVMLAVISLAIVGTFAILRSFNARAATDVDYSRTVRSAMERVRLEWQDADLYESRVLFSADGDGVNVSDYVASLNSDCSADVGPGTFETTEPYAAVSVVITCTSPDGDITQVFETEFGQP